MFLAYNWLRQFRILHRKSSQHATLPFQSHLVIDQRNIVTTPSSPAVLLEQGPPDGLRGVRGEDEIDGLVLESVEDLVARFAELRDEALERLLDVGLGGRRGLVGEVSPLELDPPSVRDLHLLSEVGEVEHVREGAGDDDGVRRRQAGKLAPELDQPRLVPIVLVLRRELVALLNLHARRDKEIRHADLEDGRGWGAYEFAEVRAVQALEDVEEAVDEERVVLDELVVLGDLAGGQQPQLRVDGLVALHLTRHGGIRRDRVPA
jgi:hypothetical protein